MTRKQFRQSTLRKFPPWKEWQFSFPDRARLRTEQEICTPQAASPQDIDRAVDAARAALKDKSWKSLTGTARGVLLSKLADLIEKNANTLASIDAVDTGKPHSLLLYHEIPAALARMRYYAGYSDKIHGQTMDCGPDKLAYTIKTPIGVVGQVGRSDCFQTY